MASLAFRRAGRVAAPSTSAEHGLYDHKLVPYFSLGERRRCLAALKTPCDRQGPCTSCGTAVTSCESLGASYSGQVVGRPRALH